MVLRPEVAGATRESFPLFRCPGCKRTGDIDFDQFIGKVSILCDCGYHETKDWLGADSAPRPDKDPAKEGEVEHGP